MLILLQTTHMSSPFHIIEPKVNKVPFILSVPHCGTEFPSEIVEHYNSEQITAPDDTDWFVQNLYKFATELGITVIYAKYSRWVIDLNRDPKSAPLYNDGRIITGLTPTTDFFGKPIYRTPEDAPDQAEVQRRLDTYYWPYYQKLTELLEERKAAFGNVILWDAHSIRHYVPTIRETIFPDMILGNNDETTAAPQLIQTALNTLKSGPFDVNHNTPFKGGHITRYFGNPSANVHALQLEMNKILYMDDTETVFDEARADKMRAVLKPTFEQLIQQISTL